jgi:predicted permease
MRWLADLSRDARYACRALARQPLFAAVAIGILGLALGANTAMVALASRFLFAHLPVRDPDRLVLLSRMTADPSGDLRFPHLFFRQLHQANDVFESVLSRAVGSERVTVGTDGGGQAALGEMVSGNFFEVLGVKPHLGRLLTSADDVTPGAHPVVVLSYRYWARQLGADPAVIGRTLRFTGVPMTVIGVSPPEFEGLDPGQIVDLRFPLAMLAEVRGGPPRPGTTRSPTFAATDTYIVARVRQSVKTARAEQVLSDRLQQFLAQSGPSSVDPTGHRGPERVRLESAATGIGLMRRDYETSLRVMMAITTSVLVIACLNVAGLIVARGSTRRREFAVRAAIGAGSGRLVRQLLAENLVLGLGAAAAGALLAYPASSSLMLLMAGGRAVSTATIEPDWNILAFHGLTSLGAVLLFGLAPALASRREASSVLRATGGGGSPVRARLVFLAAQVALAVAILVGAMLFVRTVHALRSTELGFRSDHLLLLSLSPQNAGRRAGETLPFFRAAHERVLAVPGVAGATYAWVRPLANAAWRTDVRAEGCCEDLTTALRNVVGPGYFATMGIPMVAGRDFAAGDHRDAPKVAIVNEAFARAYGGGRSVIGARLGVSRPEFTIVGISRDAKYAHLREAVPPVWFVPYEQQPNVKYLDLYIRTAGEPEGMVESVRAAIADVDRDVALFEMRTLDAQIDNLLVVERMVATVASFFGSTGAVLAALGVYGLLAFTVTTRRREIGIRMALGAGPAAIVRETVADAWRALAIGVVFGGAAAVVMGRYTASLLFGVTPLDVASFVVSVLFIAVIVSVAAFLPARRAARLDPATALRE